jgi:FG-GAP-like repeat
MKSKSIPFVLVPMLIGTMLSSASASPSPGPVRLAAIDLGTKWERHTIAAGSNTLKGSDGVHLADINNDGRFDAVSGHEQSHKVSVSLHPGFGAVESPWPTVVIPTNDLVGPEDAVFADVDGDGRKDVIVGAEGGQRVVVLFAPTNPSDLLIPNKWTRVDLAASINVMRVLRVALANVAGDSRPEIVVGGKEGNMTPATIGYYTLTNPSMPRLSASWTYTSIRPVGWVMQMFVLDVEGDGDRDIVYTDRDSIDVDVPGPLPDNSAMGLRWLESSSNTTPTWTDHQISTSRGDHKWFDIVKWDGDNDLDIVDCRSTDTIHENNLWLNNGGWQSWTQVVIPEPSGVGRCQHITFTNVDNAGALDLGITYSHADDGRSGVIWLHNAGTAAAPVWERGEISGNGPGDGIKFDNLVWYDIDNDGDLDAVTSEQHEPDPPPPPAGPGLGVIWYENPLNP